MNNCSTVQVNNIDIIYQKQLRCKHLKIKQIEENLYLCENCNQRAKYFAILGDIKNKLSLDIKCWNCKNKLPDIEVELGYTPAFQSIHCEFCEEINFINFDN